MDAAGTVCGRGRYDRRARRSSRRRDRRGRLAACLTVRRRDIRAGPPRRRADVDAIRGRGLDRGRLALGRAHLDARLSPVQGVRRAAAGVVVLGMLISLQLGHARIAYSTCGSSNASDARTSDASSAATTACPSTDAPQTVYGQLAARLGGDLARALTTQQQLSSARADTLRQRLVSASELVVAGDRAYAGQAPLAAHLLKHQPHRKARLAAL